MVADAPVLGISLLGAAASVAFTGYRDYKDDGKINKGFGEYLQSFTFGFILAAVPALAGSTATAAGLSIGGKIAFNSLIGATADATAQYVTTGKINPVETLTAAATVGLFTAGGMLISKAVFRGIGSSVDDVAGAGDGKGFNTYYEAKKYLGSPGEGNQWHHIVEQNQIEKSGFSPTQVHNTNNLIAVDKATHAQISGHYNTSTYLFTNGLKVRDWLVKKDFNEQFEYGLKVLKDYGVIK